MATLKDLYPAVFRQFMDKIYTTFDELKIYPYEVYILDSNVQSPCLFLGSISLPNEGFCGGIINMQMIYNFTFATRKSDVQAMDATSFILEQYGLFLDTFDANEYDFTVGSGTIPMRGDIIDTSPRMQMIDDGAYGAKTLAFEYSLETVTNNS